MGTLITIGQLLLSLSILVTLHEWGHFATARWFGIRVNKFYLFFDFLFPMPNVLNFSIFKFKKGDTEYGLGWFPMCGYVQIAGMVDESNDPEFLNQPVQPWEFRSKAPWQRLIVMIGGVVVNLILGILIFIGINMFWGKKYLPTQNVSYGIYADSVAQTFGFRDGDKILAIDGKPVERLHEVRKNLFINEAKTVQVDRGGEKIDLSVAGKTAVLASYKGDFIAARFPFQISKIDVESPNKGADLRYNDQIIAVNGKNTPYYSDFGNEVKHWKDKEITATVLRKADTLMTTLKVTKEGKIGVFARPVDSLLTFETQTFGLGSAITTGVSDAFGTLGNQLSAFGMMFSGKVKATESLGGFASIGSMFGSTWDWHRFWLMTGVLSLILAFMNMLPIPMLDGGYAVFIVYEMITGKEPSEKFMNVAQTIGFVLILSLLIFSNGMDIYRWLTGKL